MLNNPLQDNICGYDWRAIPPSRLLSYVIMGPHLFTFYYQGRIKFHYLHDKIKAALDMDTRLIRHCDSHQCIYTMFMEETSAPTDDVVNQDTRRR